MNQDSLRNFNEFNKSVQQNNGCLEKVPRNLLQDTSSKMMQKTVRVATCMGATREYEATNTLLAAINNELNDRRQKEAQMVSENHNRATRALSYTAIIVSIITLVGVAFQIYSSNKWQADQIRILKSIENHLKHNYKSPTSQRQRVKTKQDKKQKPAN